VIEVTPEAEPNALFASVGERVYLCFALLIGVLAGPLQAASRSLLARLAPPDKMTQYFGLFAFSGKITAFLAPLLIATVTEVATSQRAGVAVIILFFAVGLALMVRLRAG
jgi:UMF1 family MFS transporter